MNFVKLFLIAVFALLSPAVWANHLVGGEFKITNVNSGEYDIELVVYADGAGLSTQEGSAGLQDATVNVTTYSKLSTLALETINLPLVSTAFVPYNNTCTTGISTKILTYRKRVTLDASKYNNAGGYYIVWQRCCRNVGVGNIVDPAETGSVYYAEFPAIVKNNFPFVNSSPVLAPFPSEYLCAGELFQYAFKATDTDGDQLVYALEEPMRGSTSQGKPVASIPGPKPYPLVNWAPGYGLSQMIPGVPALSIDPVSGLLTVRPTKTGIFVFAVSCSEFRAGVKIGEVRRDIQVKVNACAPNQSPKVSVRPKGAVKDYVAGEILTVTDLNDMCFPVTFSDPDVGQTVTIKAVPVNFNAPVLLNPASGKINNPGQTFTTQLCWPDCKINSPSQLYTIDLIASDDACTSKASTTLRLTFRVVPKPNNFPEIKIKSATDPVTAKVGETLQFEVISTDSIDNDFLTVGMTGAGFASDAAGMLLSPISGQGKVISVFSWTPECSKLPAQNSFDVQFKVTDNSCYRNHADSVTIRINLGETAATADFLPPNIFTPNNDSFNDLFTIPDLPAGNCGERFEEVKIYSRWGNEVFTAADQNFAWNGNNAADGVYFYCLRFGKKNYKGYLTLVR